MFNRIVFFKCLDRSELVRLRGIIYFTKCTHIVQCDSYFHSSLRPQMSSETNGGDGHGGEY